MAALAASILALLFGPVMLATGAAGPRLVAAVDAFVVVVVVGVVFMHYVPHALLEAGPWVLVGMLLGLLLPFWLERASQAAGRWVQPVAFSAFVLHAALDGAALAGVHGPHAHAAPGSFAVAVVVHRIAEGFAIHHMTRESSRRASFGLLAAVVLATWLGFALSSQVEALGEARVFLFVQTLSSGALLHVVMHGHRARRALPRDEALGVLLGIAMMVALTLLHPEINESVRELSMGDTVLALVLHLAPLLLVSTLLTALLAVYARPRFALTADGLSLRLRVLGNLAHPALWVVSWGLLGPFYTGLRVLLGALSAAVLGSGPELSQLADPHAATERDDERPGWAGVFERAILANVGFLVVSVFVAAWLEPLLDPRVLAGLPVQLALLLAATLGLPLRASAVGLTPLLVVLAHKQLDPGALLAFAIAGSALRGLPARAALWQVVARVWCAALVAGALSHLLISWLGAQAFAALDLHAHAQSALEPFEGLCLVLCALSLAALLVLRGPRALFAPAWPAAHAH